MNNILQLNNTKENEFTFNVDISGIDANDVNVRFVIKTAMVNFSFICGETSEGKWEVKIPPLPQIEKTAYPFCIEVIADGYFFETMTGTINVAGSHEIYTRNVVNTTLAPPVMDVKQPETVPSGIIMAIPTNNPEPSIEESVDSIADRILKNKNTSKTLLTEKKIEKPVNKKDNKVKNILESLKSAKSQKKNYSSNPTKIKKGKTLIN